MSKLRNENKETVQLLLLSVKCILIEDARIYYYSFLDLKKDGSEQKVVDKRMKKSMEDTKK